MTVSLLTASEAAVARRVWREHFLDACDDLEACALDRGELAGQLQQSVLAEARDAAERWWGADDG